MPHPDLVVGNIRQARPLPAACLLCVSCTTFIVPTIYTWVSTIIPTKRLHHLPLPFEHASPGKTQWEVSTLYLEGNNQIDSLSNSADVRLLQVPWDADLRRLWGRVEKRGCAANL